MASVCRGLSAAFLRTSGRISGRVTLISRRARRDGLRQSAQAQALRNLHAMERRRTALQIEREILMAEIKQAKRQHSPVSSIEAELRAVTTELLSIG